ncbi:Rieske (2Fe-2S) protein [Streptomyces pathocidini]|uniref:Rieske (2Fe-2S) protein n=1 Tax=Streptomyces pathocidini TaxID=1650571 RepID=UPI003403A234
MSGTTDDTAPDSPVTDAAPDGAVTGTAPAGAGNGRAPYPAATGPDGWPSAPPGPPDRLRADSLTTRRDYLRMVTTVSGGLALGGLGVAAGALHREGDSTGSPGAKRIADSIPVGRSVAFRYPGAEDRAVAVRLSDGSLVGYSAVCTHLACAVLWRQDHGSEGELYCPCHNGAFDVRTGEVTAGPPPRPLPKVVVVERVDGSVWAIGTARSGETLEEGLCRQLLEDYPETAREIGCPGAPPVGSEEA